MNAPNNSATPSTRWTLVLEPLGVLMFRDHRPFDAGHHVLARGQFPMPSVARGAIRTALFRAAGAKFRRPHFGLDDLDFDILGCAEQSEAFELRGPLPVRRTKREGFEYLLPWPADLFAPKGGAKDQVWRLRPYERAHANASRSLRLGAARSNHGRSLERLDLALPWHDRDQAKPAHAARWLTQAGAERYAEAGAATLELRASTHWIAQDAFMRMEERIGIARATQDSDRLVAAESMLYILQPWRLRAGYGFAVEIDFGQLTGDALARTQDLLRAIDNTLLRLGGRSQHARIELVEHSCAPSFANHEPAPGQAHKLWLWTPALFDPAALATSEQGLRGALARRVRVGGFDMAKRRPRPLVSGLDKGAVLWFRAPNPTALRDHQDNYATTNLHTRARGYGCGAWIPTSNTSGPS